MLVKSLSVNKININLRVRILILSLPNIYLKELIRVAVCSVMNFLHYFFRSFACQEIKKCKVLTIEMAYKMVDFRD